MHDKCKQCPKSCCARCLWLVKGLMLDTMPGIICGVSCALSKDSKKRFDAVLGRPPCSNFVASIND